MSTNNESIQYFVTVTNGNGCTNSDDVWAWIPECRMGQLENIDDLNIKIYPNPAINEITVEHNSLPDHKKIIIELLNLQGEKLGYYSLKQSEKKEKISLANYAEGLYLYKIILDGKIISINKLLVIRE